MAYMLGADAEDRRVHETNQREEERHDNDSIMHNVSAHLHFLISSSTRKQVKPLSASLRSTSQCLHTGRAARQRV